MAKGRVKLPRSVLFHDSTIIFMIEDITSVLLGNMQYISLPVPVKRLPSIYRIYKSGGGL